MHLDWCFSTPSFTPECFSSSKFICLIPFEASLTHLFPPTLCCFSLFSLFQHIYHSRPYKLHGGLFLDTYIYYFYFGDLYLNCALVKRVLRIEAYETETYQCREDICSRQEHSHTRASCPCPLETKCCKDSSYVVCLIN